jgi:hypothetical protein
MISIDILFPKNANENYLTYPWVKYSQELMRVQADKSWKLDFAFRSYTAFVKTFSKDSGINESLLWRYLGAGKYYNKIRGNFFEWPELALLPESVSPDSLEVLGKLERVLPEEDFKKLAMSIFDQTVKREELRNLWSMYRPVLKGETARGSNKNILWVSKDNDQLGLLQYSQFVNTLIKNPMCLSSYNDSNNYRVFSKLNLPTDNHYLESLGIDVIVIGKDAKTLDVKLHGIRYILEEDLKKFNVDVLPTLNILAKYFDLLWLASGQDLSTDKIEIPSYVGIILSSDEGNKVLRTPSTTEYSGIDINRILKDLLLM